MTKTTKKTAKKPTKSKAAKTVKTASFPTNLASSTPAILHKGFRAYVGLYGAAYEAAIPAYKAVVKSYDELAVRGEKLETEVVAIAKDAPTTVSTFAQKRYDVRRAQLANILPKVANDSLSTLETEFVKFNKKVASFGKSSVDAAKDGAENIATTVTKKTDKAA